MKSSPGPHTKSLDESLGESAPEVRRIQFFNFQFLHINFIPVRSHGLVFVIVLYVILRNKIVQPKVGQSGILNVSFIYDKTSPSKGGMIGTMYCNFIIQY